jgi:uncharacterized membrane protein YhiD involved in acid resistance
MKEFFRMFEQTPGDTITLVQAAIAVVGSFLLSLIMVYVYRETHRGTSYSQSFAQTLVIMCTVVSIIMLIIGSNIARAFSLVGALSIIRYRTAIKEPRDVAFVFMVMAIGMACGTKFYDVAVVFTLLMCGIIFFMSRFNIGAKPFSEIILKMVVDKDLDYHKAFDEVFFTHLQSHALLSVDAAGEDALELVYSIQMKKAATERHLLDSLQKPTGCRRVSLLKGLQNINV